MSLTTLASKQRFYQALDFVNGHYRKHWEKTFFIEETQEAKHSVLTVPLNQLSTGQTLSSNLSVSAREQRLHFQVPKNAVVRKAAFFGWNVIWDGKKTALTGSDTLAFDVSNKDLIEVTVDDATWRMSIQEARPSFFASFAETLPDFGSLWRWFVQITKSGVTHALLLSLVLYGARLDFLWDFLKNKEAEVVPVEQVQTPPPTPIELEVLALESLRSEFNGRNVTLDGIVDRTQLSEQKSQKISDKINNTLSKLGNISLSGLHFSGIQKSAQDPNAAAASLRNKLGQGQNVDLSATFKSGLKGLAAKPFELDTSSASGKSISLKEQEEVANIFRSMQDQFRGCYESALLKDESLSVTVLFESIVSGSGILSEPALQVSGTSTPEGQKSLNQCLAGLIRKIKVSKNLSGIKIKNQFIFRS